MYDKLTRSDIQKMEEEIEHRKVVVRHELLEHVKVARAQGDLSENFEYHAAKKEKNQNEGRIRFLERMIKTAIIVEEESRTDEVGINNTVEVLFEEDQTTEKFRIVTTMRQNSLKNLISVESPMGKALMKHKVGDKVHIQVNDQYGYDVTIQSIDQLDDGSDDEIRSF